MAWVRLLRADAARDPQDPHGLDISVPGLGRSGGVAPLGGPGGGHGVFGVGLSLAPPALAVGTVDLDDGDLVGKQVPGEPGPVAAGPLDADELERPEGLQPAEQGPIARRCGREALHAEECSTLVEGGRHMDVEVRVDPSGDAARDSGHRHLVLSLGLGDTAPARRWTGQRRACAAGSYEVTPSDRLVSGECPSRADESTSGQSERTSAGFDGVRPGSGTHPHADQFSLRSGGPSAGYVNPRCWSGIAADAMWLVRASPNAIGAWRSATV